MNSWLEGPTAVHVTLILATAGTLVIGIAAAYLRGKDVLHPLLFLGPLFFLGAVVDPWTVREDLGRFFLDPADVSMVLWLYLWAVVSLVCGALHGARASAPRVQRATRKTLTSSEATMLWNLALGLAIWALAAYCYGLVNEGGFVAAFSRVKGGGRSASGYLNEGMNLSLVAAVMVALSRYRRGWTPSTLIIFGLGLIPNLLQGTLGGRRGPLFLALACATLCWLVTRRRPPKIWLLWPSMAIAALAVVFIGSQRQFLYLGSNQSVNWDEFGGALTQETVDEGNNFIYGAGFILATRHAGEYTWGRELAVNLLVRPVPRQLWPTKYEDAGATWVTSDYPGLGHVSRADWLGSVGWLPLAGSSAISISDLYGEFGWGAVLVFYLIGRGFAFLHRAGRERGGMWELLYLEALILSVYLATQSFSAFYHRYLILAVPTVVAWRLFLRPRAMVRKRVVYRRVLSRPATT